MRNHQPTFDRTGGLHAAALFDESGNLLVLHEDIGRHNAVDKVLGHALLNDWIPLTHHILLLSGRSSFGDNAKIPHRPPPHRRRRLPPPQTSPLPNSQTKITKPSSAFCENPASTSIAAAPDESDSNSFTGKLFS